MNMPRPSLTRRWILCGLASAPIVGCTQLPAELQIDAEEAVQQALGRIALPIAPSRLDLVRLRQEASGRHLHALVRLTWPPGMRQHGFHVAANTAQEALHALVSDVEDRVRNEIYT